MQRLIQKIEPSTASLPQLLRVAAYARVSSGKDAMLHSLSAQVGYYTELIQSNPEWRFCGVYADEALTGTKDNREQFQIMLAECRKGNINLIITKSISRFARNTVTLLETVRELKELGVGVLFEEQNIHSLSSDGELMLSILASYAQEESYSASENQKWRIHRNFEEGKIGSIRMLGYKRTPDGSLEIIPEEAETVRLIFNSYLSGMGKQTIANMLNEMQIPTINGCEWTAEDIRRILKNEKYAGNMLLQKKFRENPDSNGIFVLLNTPIKHCKILLAVSWSKIYKIWDIRHHRNIKNSEMRYIVHTINRCSIDKQRCGIFIYAKIL